MSRPRCFADSRVAIITPRPGFELAAGHPRWIADDAAVAAAERDVCDGAFPRHPRRQGGDFVEGDPWVIADPAFRWSERDVVLHAIAGEDFDLAVIHLD